MKDLNRRSLLFTTLIAVLCTIICPSAQGDSILFTTTVTASDSWHKKMTDGPVSGAANFAFDNEGYGADGYGNSWHYIADSDTSPAFADQLFSDGKIQVGELASSGEVDGFVTGKVQGTVNFSMTIGEAESLPNSAPATQYSILFQPNALRRLHNGDLGR
jgi:hypothetical protein